MNKNLTYPSFIAAALLAALPCSLSARQITWGSVQTETGSVSDILTTGTFVNAVTPNSGSPLVNGVTFNSGLSSVENGTQIQILNGQGYSTTLGIGSTPTDSSWPSAYQNLVGGGEYTAGSAFGDYGNPAGNMVIELSGLTPGASYEVEILEPFWNVPWPTTWSDGVNATGDASGSLLMGNHGSVPDYVTGTFTAGPSGLEYIYGSPTPGDPLGGYSLLAGVEVRQEIACAPDHMSTWAVLASVVGGLLAFRRPSQTAKGVKP